MKTKKSIKKVSLLGSALIAGSLAGFSIQNANAAALFESNALGSGAELRARLIESNSMANNTANITGESSTIKFSELKCGEGKCGGENDSIKETKGTKDKKAAEGEAKTADTKKAEDKTKEAKCGEGKCG